VGVVDALQLKTERLVLRLALPCPMLLRHIRFRLLRCRRFILAGCRRKPEPVLKSYGRIAHAAIFHGRDQVQHIAVLAAGKAVEIIFYRVGVKSILTLTLVDRTATPEFLSTFP